MSSSRDALTLSAHILVGEASHSMPRKDTQKWGWRCRARRTPGIGAAPPVGVKYRRWKRRCNGRERAQGGWVGGTHLTQRCVWKRCPNRAGDVGCGDAVRGDPGRGDAGRGDAGRGDAHGAKASAAMSPIVHSPQNHASGFSHVVCAVSAWRQYQVLFDLDQTAAQPGARPAEASSSLAKPPPPLPKPPASLSPLPLPPTDDSRRRLACAPPAPPALTAALKPPGRARARRSRELAARRSAATCATSGLSR